MKKTPNIEALGVNIKDPYIFEILGLKPKDVMSESHLEQELIFIQNDGRLVR